MGAGLAIAEVGVAVRSIEKLPNEIAPLFADALRLIREIDKNGYWVSPQLRPMPGHRIAGTGFIRPRAVTVESAFNSGKFN
jgi:hypothetical protein